MKYIFINNGILNGAGECKCIDEDTMSILVSNELYQTYCEAPDKFVYSGGQIVENPKYAEIVKEREAIEHNSKIIEKLNELDAKRIRALCEMEIKDEESGETWLEYYNKQIAETRNELIKLNS